MTKVFFFFSFHRSILSWKFTLKVQEIFKGHSGKKKMILNESWANYLNGLL